MFDLRQDLLIINITFIFWNLVVIHSAWIICDVLYLIYCKRLLMYSYLLDRDTLANCALFLLLKIYAYFHVKFWINSVFLILILFSWLNNLILFFFIRGNTSWRIIFQQFISPEFLEFALGFNFNFFQFLVITLNYILEIPFRWLIFV